MATFFIVVAVNIAGLFLIYLALKERVKRYALPASEIERVREEVNKLIIELNQTAERNIVLIEDKVAGLNDLLTKADKKMGLLRRESEKHEVGAKIYGRLAEAQPPRQEKQAGIKEPVQEEVVRLHRAGLSSGLIANRVNATVGEVELIISLEEPRG